MSASANIFRRFVRDERGVFAVLFGLMSVVLLALGGAVVDYVRLEQTRQRAQNALDSAVLALQPDIRIGGITNDQLRERAEAVVLERIGDASVTAQLENVRMDTTNGSLYIDGRFSIPTIFVRLVGVPTLNAVISSEALQGALDIEVAVALDLTGSMAGQRIEDLKVSVRDLVNAVVSDTQTPNYSKMAFVPYSQAVNAGQYAEAIRGPITAGKNAQSLSWASQSAKTITAMTKSAPVRVTTSGNHGYSDGDWVFIHNIYNGMYSFNNKPYQITRISNTQFDLRNSDGRYEYSFWGYGDVTKCDRANCNVLVNATNHGFSNGDFVALAGFTGLTTLNGQSFEVSNRTQNSMVLLRSTAGLTRGSPISATTGKLYCTTQTLTEGCEYYRFQSATGTTPTFRVSTCVTDRGSGGINDNPPSTQYAGRNYPAGNNPCLANPIVPLTTDKARLNAAINQFEAVGSTAGSVGILWSWYMLSPNFGYLWPFESRPAAYRADNLMKAAVIMTDGEFNTVHCNGVVSRQSTSGSGNEYDKINCDSPNGDPYRQAERYCDAMKANGIVIYTVGFGLSEGTPAANVLRYCASGASSYFLAADGAALQESFKQIAKNISALRISR